MVKRFSILVAVLVGAFLLAYMFLFQVRYDEAAVVTTFNRPTSIKKDAGAYPCWPWPIQRVKTYSTLLQVLESETEQINTGDHSSIVVRYYVAWRIDEPLLFYNSMRDVDRAQEFLRGPLKEEFIGQLGRYRFDQLVNVDAAQGKLKDIEDAVLANLQARLADLKYGIRVEQVGIRRLLLPEANTQEVFEAMRKTRERMAAEIKASGEAQARAIEANADAARQRILAFADGRRQAIIAQGLTEAAKYYEKFRADETLAIALKRIETLKKIMAHNATIVVESRQLGAEPITAPRDTPPKP
jgi:modulator of FtsH protease HflC